MIINKVIQGGSVLLDLTQDTVSENNLLLNETAHNREGEPIRGTHISGGAVSSVNGKTGDVVLDANDVGALPSNTPIPSKTSDLTNDSGYVTASILPIGGTTGQVLAKKSNSDYDTEWVDQSGGGGTSNYNDLSNKPQINGNSLSGNKTGSQLGLQNIILSSALTIGGQTVTEVEPALHALNNKSGGHTIVDSDGVTMPQRAKLKFVGCTVTDDSTNDTTIVEAEGGGGGYFLADVANVELSANGTTATIKWTDPNDIVVSGVTLAEWAGTKVVRKVGSAPADETDGTLVINSTTKNAYSSTGYSDTGLSFNTTYYYRFFPYTTNGNVTNGTSESVFTSITITVTLYSAAADTVTFTDLTGSKTVVTDNTGKAENVSITCANNSSITFASSVAKDPENLSNDYSKSVTIADNTLEIFTMPSNTLYWFGYNSNTNPIRSASVANGWTSSYSYSEPTWNTNSLTIQKTGNTTFQGFASKNKVSGTKAYALASSNNSTDGYWTGMTKIEPIDIGSNYWVGTEYPDIPTTISKQEATFPDSDAYYIGSYEGQTRQVTFYALWYE